MPGIVGLITQRSREWAEPQLLRMVESIRHLPSYRTGTWIDESAGIYLGWAVHANSFSDGMPLRNERGDVTMVFSGEEFPSPEVKGFLRSRGHEFDNAGPSYLVHWYEEDAEFPNGLNGRFHGFVADHRRGEASLFIDRYAMNRVYYHASQDAFYFAGEAKAILAARPELRSTDDRGLGEYIALGCVLENRTLFKDISILPAASVWTFRNGELSTKKLHFDPRQWEQLEPLEPESFYGKLKDVFSRNLPRYFEGREQMGLSLTGGLDTRMIMAWHNPEPGSVPCYTFRGMYNDCQDLLIGREVAAIWKQSHQEILLGQEFLANFEKYAERTVYLTDGCADVSRSPILYTNEKAARIAPIRITGNYGSEVLRRLVAFKPGTPHPGLFQDEVVSHVKNAKTTYSELLKGNAVSFIAFRQVPWHHWGLLSLELSQLTPRSPYLDNDLVETAFRAPDSSAVKHSILADHEYCLRLIGDGNPKLRSVRTDRGVGGNGGLSTLLARIALEVTFKAEYEYDYGMPQWLARTDHHLSKLHLERLFLGRHKYYHFRIWYRDLLSPYIRAMLLDSKTLSRSYLQRHTVESIVNEHTSGKANHTLTIHKLLTLELMHRTLLDASALPAVSMPRVAASSR